MNVQSFTEDVHFMNEIQEFVKYLGSDNSLKSPQISKVSVQTASNTPWMQGKEFLLRILQHSCPVKSIVNYPIYTIRPQLELGPPVHCQKRISRLNEGLNGGLPLTVDG